MMNKGLSRAIDWKGIVRMISGGQGRYTAKIMRMWVGAYFECNCRTKKSFLIRL